MSTQNLRLEGKDSQNNFVHIDVPITVADYDVVVNSTQDAAAIINAQPAGTEVQRRRILVQGFHRLTGTVVPKAYTDLTIDGTFDGSVVITGWAADGADRWSVSGKLPGAYSDVGVPEFTTGPYANSCKFRETLFIDGIQLKRVTSLAAVGEKAYYGDYSANKIYIGDNPTNKIIEMSKLPFLIRTTASHVCIFGDGILRRAATPSQSGAVQLEGPDCHIEGVRITSTHAIGLRIVNSHRTVVNNVYVDHCGQLGIACTSSHDTQWLASLAVLNNTEGYRPDDWESGGFKMTRSLRAYCWDIRTLNNYGVGFWCDIDNNDTVVTWLRSDDNASDGFRHEISGNLILAHTEINRNGLYHRPDSGAESVAGKDPGPFATAGININSSGGKNNGRIWIHHCNVKDNRNGIFVQQRTRTDPAWLVKNVLVEDCMIKSAILINPTTNQRWVDQNGIATSSMSGIGALSQTAARSAEIYNTDVQFRNNQYGASELIMRWTGTAWRAGTLAQAQSAGQEEGSTLLSG